MKNLIKGDIRRIMCKRSFWIAFIASVLINFAIVLFYLFGMNYSSLNYLQGNIDGMGDLGGTVLGVAVFLAVYADDFKSMTIISVIGRGNSRLKVILAKFINSVIITLLLYAIFSLQVFIMTKVMGITLLPDESLALGLAIFRGIFLTIGYVTIAAIVIYTTGNMPFSVFMIVMFYIVVPTVLMVTATLPILKNIHLERYDYNGLTSAGISDIILGMPVNGILTLLLAFIIYVGGSLAIIYAVFNKKELDF